jgi:hypoxanthine-DNA glycosylase
MNVMSLPAIVQKNSLILILGTMPGENAVELQQYYANKGNQFWKILSTVFDAPFPVNYADRLNLLLKHRIALWEVLHSCERQGSSDQKIRNEKPNDIESFIKEYPSIRYIFFESKAAESFYKKYLPYIDGLTYGQLPSPSGANARISFDVKVRAWMVLKDISEIS